ncbi:MAG: hypothetical protein ABI579_00560 [Candidatus Sumerlaeota bacterium]
MHIVQYPEYRAKEATVALVALAVVLSLINTWFYFHGKLYTALAEALRSTLPFVFAGSSYTEEYVCDLSLILLGLCKFFTLAVWTLTAKNYPHALIIQSRDTPHGENELADRLAAESTTSLFIYIVLLFDIQFFLLDAKYGEFSSTIFLFPSTAAFLLFAPRAYERYPNTSAKPVRISFAVSSMLCFLFFLNIFGCFLQALLPLLILVDRYLFRMSEQLISANKK